MKHSPEEIAAALEVLADVIADRVALRLLTDQHPDWVDQAASPLGPRRHRAAVTRRMNKNDPGAARIGRRYLLSREALNAELSAAGERKPETKPSVAEDLRSRLGLPSRV